MFHLRTLGGAALESGGVPLDSVGAQRKTLALLILLAAARQQGISRDRLAAFLWPESDIERARGGLKQALHVLRRQVGSPTIVLGSTELRLNGAEIATDLDAFLGAIEAGDHEAAVASYGGPFLDGFHLAAAAEFEQWVAAQRDDLARRYAGALEQLALAAGARGEHAAAAGWWRRLQAEDPLSGRATLGLMQALDAAGERAAALRCAQAHEALLRDELGTGPDPAITALASQLRTRTAPSEAVEAAPVTPAIRVLREEPRPADRALQPARPVDRRFGRVGRVVAAFGLIAMPVLVMRPWERSAPAAAPSVAVLPFVNASGDTASNHLSEGFTDELVGALRRMSELNIAARSSTTALASRGLDARAIADTLAVGAVVEGSIQREGSRLYVTARLIDPRDSLVLWSETYERAMRDIFAVQEDIARAVASTLGARMADAEGRGGLAGRRTPDLEAYDLYLRGRHSWRRRTRDGLEQAVLFYEQAIERDPGFAIGYAGLAEAYVNLSNFGFRPLGQALALADVAAGRALELDSALAEAHAAKGFVLASRLEFEASEASFQRAIRLGPDYTWGHHYYTLLLMMLGRTGEAREHNHRALALDPFSRPANATRGIILCQEGDYPAARRELEQALVLAPDFALTLYYLGGALAAQGELDEAMSVLERARRAAPGFTGVPGSLAQLHRRAGRVAASDSILAAAQQQVADPRGRMNLALTYAALEQYDAAFALMNELSWDVPSLIDLRASPFLAGLRSDSRYSELLRTIGTR